MKYLSITILLISILFSCSEDIDDNISPTYTVQFNFTHHWNETLVTPDNFQNLELTNQNGEVLNIQRFRYLLSKIALVNVVNNDTYTFDGYKFTDLENEDSYNFTSLSNSVPSGVYNVSLIWGFNEEENIDGIYPDLNSASWNWPAMLGGGYHFLQFDGMYDVNTNSPKPFNYHYGTARVEENVFEQNFATITINQDIAISNNTIIEIELDIAELFKNPNTWDLNVYDTPLMPNYEAQKMMQQNVSSAFNLGEITQ